MESEQIILELKGKIIEGKSFEEIQELLKTCSKFCSKIGNEFQDKLCKNKIIDYVISLKNATNNSLIFLINALTSNLNNQVVLLEFLFPNIISKFNTFR